jgi:hypothetical protein
MWALDGEADSPLVEDACIPVDTPLSEMTLSVINLIKTSSAAFFTVFNALDICTKGEQFTDSGDNLETVMR